MWLWIIGGWFLGSIITVCALRFLDSLDFTIGDVDEAIMFASPFMPFWPFILLMCLCAPIIAVWEWLN